MANEIKAIKKEIDGIVFDSKTEAKFYEYLKDLKSQGKIIEFSLQPKFTLIEPFVNCNKRYKAMTYKLDFLVVLNNGSKDYVDIKGYQASDRTVVKVKLLRSQHLDTKISLVRPYKGGWVDLETNKPWEV